MITKKTVVIYEDTNGREPFTEWFGSLKDRIVRVRIGNRLSRLELGHYGDFEFIDDGIFELRFFFGSGYRIYFGEYEMYRILLLCGGDKKTQKKDILKAKAYWKEFMERQNEKI